MLTNLFTERNYAGAILAGIIAMLVMGIFAYLIVPLIGRPALDFGFAIGTFFLPAGATAVVLGLVLAPIAGIIWALIYDRVVRVNVSAPDWLTGMVWGLIAWVIAGLALGGLSAVHPLVAAGQIRNPGFFGLGFGEWVMPVSIFLAFLVYGLALGLVYALLASRFDTRARDRLAA